MTEHDRSSASIQHFPRPTGTDARWLADHYFDWLTRTVPATTAVHTNQDVELRVRPFASPAIVLRRSHSEPGRVAFLVCGGWLVGPQCRGAFEFDVEEEGFRVALRDFSSVLPRFIYWATQALVHRIVMWAFGRHLHRLLRRQIADEGGEDEGRHHEQ
jgi:hypothetical protein